MSVSNRYKNTQNNFLNPSNSEFLTKSDNKYYIIYLVLKVVK